MNCKLEFLYYFTRPALSMMGYHRHNCHELVYYISGFGNTNIDGAEYGYRQGSFALIGPGVAHDERRAAQTDVLFIGFQYDGLPVPLGNGVFEDSPQMGVLLILQRLKDEMLKKAPYYELKLEVTLQELVIEVLRTVRAGAGEKSGFPHVESFLKENFAQVIDFETLAELAGYSYHRFRHLFKEHYGDSPHQFVIRLRLQHAAKRLAATNHTVLSIAQECGFASQSQFCSLFSRAYGCSPGSYRKTSNG